MSYTTDFSLSIIQARPQVPSGTDRPGPSAVEAAPRGVTRDDVDVWQRAVEFLRAMNDGDDVLDQPCAWYDHEAQMREVSTQMRETVFALYGTCEDYEERWVKYFVNGQMQVEEAVITYGAFDPSKLR